MYAEETLETQGWIHGHPLLKSPTQEFNSLDEILGVSEQLKGQ
jgi:hypothetical protein